MTPEFVMPRRVQVGGNGQRGQLTMQGWLVGVLTIRSGRCGIISMPAMTETVIAG